MSHYNRAVKLATWSVLVTLSVISTVSAQRSAYDAGSKNNLDGDEIRTRLLEYHRAATDLPRTRDIDSILEFFDRNYTHISQDGEWEDLGKIRKDIAGIVEQMNLGSPIGISASVTNIKVHQIIGNFAWATYDSIVKVGVGGKTLESLDTRCTAVLKKIGQTWYLLHEHSSKRK